jgi:hypothetical protein
VIIWQQTRFIVAFSRVHQKSKNLFKLIPPATVDFEKRTTFKDSLFYDVSGWTFPPEQAVIPLEINLKIYDTQLQRTGGFPMVHMGNFPVRCCSSIL